QKALDGAPSSNHKISAFSLTLSEKLYDNGIAYTQNKLAQLKLEQLQKNLILERDRLCLELAREYLNYATLNKLFEIRKSRHKMLLKQFKIVSNAYHQGARTRQDFLRLKTEIN